MKRVRAGYFGEMTKTLNLEDLIIEFSAEMSCSIARHLYDTVVALRDMEPRRDIDIMALATNKV